MSFYLEDAERLYRDADYALNSAIGNLRNSKYFFEKSPTEENKKWMELDMEKVSIIDDIVDELAKLVAVIKKQDEMLNSEQNAQVSDTTEADQGTEAGNQIK